MTSKRPSEPPSKAEFDSLALYHHATHAFDAKLKNLLSILDMPKESALEERFKHLESILDKIFRLELIHYLNLKNTEALIKGSQNTTEHHQPQILLHLLCLLECTDSVEYIAHYLELTEEEVKELIRELHKTFSIDSLTSRVRQYYQQNKKRREAPERQKESERLGIEPSSEPKDSTEDRRQRILRRYGHLATVFDRMSHPI